MPATHLDLDAQHVQALAQDFGLHTVSVQQVTGKVFRLQAKHGAFALRFFNTGIHYSSVAATQQLRSFFGVGWTRGRCSATQSQVGKYY